MSEEAKNQLRSQLRTLIEKHQKWASSDHARYNALIYASIVSSVAGSITALAGGNKYVVAAASGLPVFLSAIKSHLDYGRRMRWNYRFVRELNHLLVLAADRPPEEISEKLRVLQEKMDEDDPDEPPRKKDLVPPRTKTSGTRE